MTTACTREPFHCAWEDALREAPCPTAVRRPSPPKPIRLNFHRNDRGSAGTPFHHRMMQLPPAHVNSYPPSKSDGDRAQHTRVARTACGISAGPLPPVHIPVHRVEFPPKQHRPSLAMCAVQPGAILIPTAACHTRMSQRSAGCTASSRVCGSIDLGVCKRCNHSYMSPSCGLGGACHSCGSLFSTSQSD